jgi:short-subunit dehydrogenase
LCISQAGSNSLLDQHPLKLGHRCNNLNISRPQAAGRVMIRQKGGRIINLSSQAGFVALPTESEGCYRAYH